MMKFSPIILLIVLSACAGYNAEQAAKNEQSKREYCASVGAPEGSDNYYDCRMQIDQRRHDAAMEYMRQHMQRDRSVTLHHDIR